MEKDATGSSSAREEQRTRASSTRKVADGTTEQHEPQHQAPSKNAKRTIRGVVIPPLDLRSTNQEPGTPDPSVAANGSGGSTDAPKRSSDNNTHPSAKPVHDGAGDRRSSGYASAAVGTSPRCSETVYLPDGVEGILSDEEKASREAMAAELGTSYVTRAYKEHLRAHNLRPPGVLERIPTPSDEVTLRQRERACSSAQSQSQSQSQSLFHGHHSHQHPHLQSRNSHSHSHSHSLASSFHGSQHTAAAAVRHSPSRGPARVSNGDARSSCGTPLPPGAAEQVGSNRPFSAAVAVAAAAGVAETPETPQQPQQQQDTPRSFAPLMSARSATSDGRVGTAPSSLGMGDLDGEQVEPTPTPTPPQPQPAAKARGAGDGVETLDEIIAPAFRERIRQLLAAQDALLGHRARMRDYEESREKVLRGRREVSATPATPGHGGAGGATGRVSRRSSLFNRLANGRNNQPGVRNGGRTGGGRESHPSSREPSPVMLRAAAPSAQMVAAAVAVAVAAVPAKPASAAGRATSPPPLPAQSQPPTAAAAAAAAASETPKASLPAVQHKAGAPAATGRALLDGTAEMVAGGASGPGRVTRPVGLSTSRSLKRVQLVPAKKENPKEKTQEMSKDQKNSKATKVRHKVSSGGGSTISGSNASGSSNSESGGSSSSSSSVTGSSSSSSGESEGSSRSDEAPAKLRKPRMKSAATAAITAAGPFATPAAAAAAAATAPSTTTEAKASASTATTGAAAAAAATPRSCAESSMTSMLGSTTSAATGTQSYGTASNRSNHHAARSSLRSGGVPTERRMILPGAHGDLNHLMLLLEKLPLRTPRTPRAKPQATVAGAGATSSTRGSLTAVPSLADTGRTSPDHRQRLSQQIQLHTPRSGSPNSRFAYGNGEPNVWGETVAAAALYGFPTGAAAVTLAKCEEKQPSCHKGTLSSVAGALAATAEPSGLFVLTSPEATLAAADAAAAVAAPDVPGFGADEYDDYVDDMPLAVQLMMGIVSEYELLSAAGSSLSLSMSRSGLGPVASEAQRSTAPAAPGAGRDAHDGADGSLLHHHLHHHHHHHHHHRHHVANHQGDRGPAADLHEMHENLGTQIRLRHRQRHHQHNHGKHPQQDGDTERARRQSDGVMYGTSPRRSVRGNSPTPLLPMSVEARHMDRPYSADDGLDGGSGGGSGGGGGLAVRREGSGGSRGRGRELGGGGGGGTGSDNDDDDLEKIDPSWRALQQRRRLPSELTLPARLTGAAPAAREGGGAHSFQPEQLAAMFSSRAVNGGGGGALAAAAGGAAASSSSSMNMPPLRVPLPLPAAARGGGGGGGALLPGLGAKAAAAERDRGRGPQGTSGAAGTGSAAELGNSPIYELYALGLLPNPSLLRASMAAATTSRAHAPSRRRQPGFAAASATSATSTSSSAAGPRLAFGDLPRRSPSPSVAAAAALTANNFFLPTAPPLPPALPAHPQPHPHHHHFHIQHGSPRQDLGPLGGPMALYRKATAAAASAPTSPMPQLFVHTQPHVVPGSSLQVAEAAEAEEMQARLRMGRTGALDLQHMLGVDVPPQMLQAR